MKATLVTTEKARFEEVDGVYWVYYHPLKYKSNSQVEIEIEDVIGLNVKAGCQSCTKTNLQKTVKEEYSLKITYDTTIIGNFTKTVNLTFTENGQSTKKMIKITGTVQR